jgi:phenylalanyl-tRNA synthetase beta chain
LSSNLAQGTILDKNADSTLDVFRSFKGDVETLLDAFGHKSLKFDAQTSDYYLPGRSARATMGGDLMAQFGQLHPQVAANRKLRGDVFIAEVFADRLLNRSLREIRYEPLPKFPAVTRDFSFLFADEVTFDKIEATVHAIGLSELRSFLPVEIFRGGAVSTGRYSILLRARFQSLERTLREDEVADWSTKIVGAIEGLGGTQRA